MDNFLKDKTDFDNLLGNAKKRKEEQLEPTKNKIEKQKQLAQFECLKEQRKEVQEHVNTKSATESKNKKARKSLGRTQILKARFTLDEEKIIREKIRVSGMAQGEFIRSMLLNGRVEVIDHTKTLFNVLSEVSRLKAEIGRQGGMLKSIIKPNYGQRELAPEEWEELISTIKQIENNKKKIEELERKIINGDYYTS